MITRFVAAVILAFALAPAAALADNELQFYISKSDYAGFAYYPHEHCRQPSAHQILCKSADPNGSTIGVKAYTQQCFIDFARKNDQWVLLGVRGHCTARFEGSNSIYVRGK